MDIGFKLKKVQMPPGSFDSIMHAATWIAAFRTRKFAAWFEVNVYIKLLSFGTEIYCLDVPRIFKIQCYLK